MENTPVTRDTIAHLPDAPSDLDADVYPISELSAHVAVLSRKPKLAGEDDRAQTERAKS